MDQVLLVVVGLALFLGVAVLSGLLAYLHSRRVATRVAELERELGREILRRREAERAAAGASAPPVASTTTDASSTPSMGATVSAPASSAQALPAPVASARTPFAPGVSTPIPPASDASASSTSAPTSDTASPKSLPSSARPATPAVPSSPPTVPHRAPSTTDAQIATPAGAWSSRAAVPPSSFPPGSPAGVPPSATKHGDSVTSPDWPWTTSTAPGHASPASATPPPPRPATTRIDFEQWVGVRGAAVLGGIVVAIAGFFLLQYSIERGYFTPRARVILGAIVAVACLVGAAPLRRRGYEIVANSISGAGAVILFACAWAAHVLYGMIGFEVAFASMAATTALCMFLAHRHSSLVIAVLGLVGGFATPIVLASSDDRPIPLFGYILLLDLAFLFLAQKRRWPSIGLIALCGTFLIQCLWVLRRMSAESLVLALVMLAVFALVFAFFVARLPGAERRRWMASQVGALVLPFFFALYFSQDRELGEHLAPIAGLALVLSLASGWLARTSGMAWLPYGSASGSVALAFTWTVAREVRLATHDVVELSICGVVLVVVHAAFAELANRSARSQESSGASARDVLASPSNTSAATTSGQTKSTVNPVASSATGASEPAASRTTANTLAGVLDGALEILRGARDATLVCALGFLTLAVFVASRADDVGPRATVALALVATVVVFRLVALGAHGAAAITSAGLLGLVLRVWAGAHGATLLVPRPIVWCASVVVMGGIVLACAWSCSRAGSRRPARPWIAYAVAAFVVPAAFAPWQFGDVFTRDVALYLGTALVMSLQVACAAGVDASSPLYMIAVVCAWIANATVVEQARPLAAGAQFLPVFLSTVGVAAVLSWWPVARPDVWKGKTGVWRAAAVVPFAWYFVLRPLYGARWGGAPIFVLPMGLEVLAGSAAVRLHRLRGDEDRARRIGRVWFACAAVLFAAMIVPVQVGRDEEALTLALFAVGLALLWRRFDVAALRWVAAVALALATMYLCVVRPWSAFPHSDVRVWNVLAWLYVTPAIAAVITTVVLRSPLSAAAIADAQRFDVARGDTPTTDRAIRDAARGGTTRSAATHSGFVPPVIAGICAVILGFVWLNLEIANTFSEGVSFHWRVEHDPARNLTVSIAWAVYALALLVVGVVTKRAGPRWASLVLVLLTIGKVFLFDLGHLTGLYRAASVFGLGISLLLVSILYQRFVFRRVRETGA